MKYILIAIIGIALVTGCASTPEPAATEYKTYTQDDLYLSKRQTVKECILELMEREAHVLDATESCSHIYGLTPNKQRVKTLGTQ